MLSLKDFGRYVGKLSASSLKLFVLELANSKTLTCLHVLWYLFQGGFNWNSISFSENDRNKTVKHQFLKIEEEDLSGLQFAVSLTTRETTGSMTWEEYRFDNLDTGMNTIHDVFERL